MKTRELSLSTEPLRLKQEEIVVKSQYYVQSKKNLDEPAPKKKKEEKTLYIFPKGYTIEVSDEEGDPKGRKIQ